MPYIKCTRLNGLVLSDQVYERLPLQGSDRDFWVHIPAGSNANNRRVSALAWSASGPLKPWQPLCPEDQVSFKPTNPLPSSQPQPIVLSEDQGLWQHSISAQQLEQMKQWQQRQAKNQALHRAIKAWCESQAEGREESFMNYGIEDIEHPRYLAYRSAVAEIKAQLEADTE